MQELISAVCEYYGSPVDDRINEDPDHVSLHDVAEKFGITVMKARKILITANLYSTATSRRVQSLIAEGKSTKEVQEITGLGRSSVNSYIPYDHIVYKLPDISIKAERQKQYRVRKRNKDRTEAEIEEKLWNELVYMQGCIFRTAGRSGHDGVDIVYRIKGGEMFVDLKEKSITRATVMKAYRRVVELDGIVKGPKTLGTFGASYLYPVFVKMGIIKMPED
jgi:hypothetical protein